jgi:hypothetical protein
MGKWEKLRWILRGTSAAMGAIAAVLPLSPISLILIGASAAMGTVTIDLPRDPWPETKRRSEDKTPTERKTNG